LTSKSILKRGFKTHAEKQAIEYRTKLSLKQHDPLDAFALSNYLQIPIYSATNLLTSQVDSTLLMGSGENDCGWSALTMITKAGNKIIIHNPFHSSARQQSNIMHELSHIICKHEHAAKYDFELPLGMRHFNELHEEEAKCLGAALQITRPGLLWALNRNMSQLDIANHYNASLEMVSYRLNTSGVLKQHSYSNK